MNYNYAQTFDGVLEWSWEEGASFDGLMDYVEKHFGGFETDLAKAETVNKVIVSYLVSVGQNPADYSLRSVDYTATIPMDIRLKLATKYLDEVMELARDYHQVEPETVARAIAFDGECGAEWCDENMAMNDILESHLNMSYPLCHETMGDIWHARMDEVWDSVTDAAIAYLDGEL